MIATPCGRSDLFAVYTDGKSRQFRAVVGWDENGRAVAQKDDGSTVIASRHRPANIWRFERVLEIPFIPTREPEADG